MFAGKARAYLSEAAFRCSNAVYAQGLTHENYTRLERLAWDKHSSLLLKIVTYACKMFYKLVPSKISK
jgi:hypothetical protein